MSKIPIKIKRLLKKEKYIVVGEKKYLERIFENFKNLNKYIEFIIDEEGFENETYLEKAIVKYNILDTKDYSKYKFVIFNPNTRKNAIKKLTKNYKIPRQNIIYGSEWLLHILKTYKKVLIHPTALRIDICSKCQLNCVACYMRIDNYGTVGKGYMKFEKYKEIIDKYPFIKEVEISNNGEPFLNPDIKKILEYSYEKNVSIVVDNGTNFNYVPNDVLEAIAKYKVKRIALSIDGASNTTYKQYRVNGDFNVVMDNVKKLNNYKEKYNKGEDIPYINWKYVLMEHNENEVEKAIRMEKDLKLHMYFCLDWRGFTPKNPQKMKELTGIDFLYKGKPTLYPEFCLFMLRSPQINWDGRLLGCCMTYKTDWKKNIFTDGLIESLNSEYYRHAIYKLLGDKTDYGETNQCTDNCYTYRDFISKGEYLDL